jgi:hypothetical protein
VRGRSELDHILNIRSLEVTGDASPGLDLSIPKTWGFPTKVTVVGYPVVTPI